MAQQYDIVLTDSGGDNNFMLRQEGQIKHWRVEDAPLLPQTLITESASPSHIQPEREIQISQVDWRKGFQDFLLEDSRKYYDSENCDARIKGQVILSPEQETAISFGAEPPNATLTDGGMDIWVDANNLTHWTKTGDGILRESSIKRSGSYSAKDPALTTPSGTIYQDISWNNLYRLRTFTFTCWAYSTSRVTNWVKVSIDDGVSSTQSDKINSSNTTWEQGTVTRKLDANATRLRLIIEYTATSGENVYMDDAALSYTDWDYGAVVNTVEFGDDIIVAMGNTLWNIASGSAVYLYAFPKTITDLCVYQNRLYIAQGWSDAYYYTSDLSTFTESILLAADTDNTSATTSAYWSYSTSIEVVNGTVYGATSFYASWEDEVVQVTNITGDTLTVVRGVLGSTAAYHASGTDITELGEVTGAKYMSNVGDSQFWISDTNNTMRDSDDPINNGTPFSSQYTVGSDAYDITGLVDHEEVVFCRKEDDVYYLSEADVKSLLNLKTEASTTYTHGLYTWGDKLYIPSGVNSLYEYDIASGVATTISPTRYATNDTNYDGILTAITHDESYLYLAMVNGSDVKILSGRWENVEGSTDWWWHPLYDYASNDITAMLISSASGDKRLYAGTDTYTDGIDPFVVPISYSGIYLEDGYTAEAAGEFITPWFATNFPTEEKYWKSIDITSICITDKTSITPYYQIKGGAWTAMTVLTASALDGTDYPAETTDNREIEQTSERIRFKFVFATSDTDYTPILYGSGGGFVVYANLLPDRSRQIVATIDLAPQIMLRDHSIVERQVDDDLTTLRGLYTANETITCTGPDGTEYEVIFARDGYTEQLAYEDQTNRIEHWWCGLRLLEV